MAHQNVAADDELRPVECTLDGKSDASRLFLAPPRKALQAFPQTRDQLLVLLAQRAELLPLNETLAIRFPNVGLGADLATEIVEDLQQALSVSPLKRMAVRCCDNFVHLHSLFPALIRKLFRRSDRYTVAPPSSAGFQSMVRRCTSSATAKPG